ncbi:MAG: hypothetical protein CME62_02105 [Halobacteriovoraceae bacterium]|nr:hypothetical protein [Halobacteriovoraceae bacterium]|tara:strand:- start:2525 stop:3061 length:537 start_codon:yes stop_codon:yes gene_type:complete
MSDETIVFSIERINLEGTIVSSLQNFLVIEDEGGILELIEGFLEIIGFKGKIHKAQNLDEAKKFLKYEKVDFIISDWNLPDGEGISLLKAIRKSKRYFEIPFLMVTGDDSVDSMILSSQYGSSDYLVKPFTLNDFKHKLAEAWRTHTIPTQEKIYELEQKIVELLEENESLKEQLAKK